MRVFLIYYSQYARLWVVAAGNVNDACRLVISEQTDIDIRFLFVHAQRRFDPHIEAMFVIAKYDDIEINTGSDHVISFHPAQADGEWNSEE